MTQDLFEQVVGADILIVDDTPDNIRFLSSLLAKKGYKVRKALTGQMALIAVRTLTPDLILLDINMPEMDGYEVCRRLKEDQASCSIPVIFLSAWDAAEDKVKAFQVGGIDYITKPFQFEEVLIRIQNQLTIRNLQKQLQSQNSQLRQVIETLGRTQLELTQREKIINLNRLAIGMINGLDQPLSQISNHLAAMQKTLPMSQSMPPVQSDRSAGLFNSSAAIDANPAVPDPAIPDIAIPDTATPDAAIPGLDQAIHSIQAEVSQIQTILLALHDFAVNTPDVMPIDIHQAIDRILLLLKPFFSRLYGALPVEIELVKEYGQLPLVTCSINLFNQAIFNLFGRAIDALEARSRQIEDLSFQPRIWIKTEVSSQGTVLIHIQDNGVQSRDAEAGGTATPADLLDRFTWSSPEELKHLPIGVLVCQQIVENLHQGRLRHQTLTDRSEFIVEMPVHLPA